MQASEFHSAAQAVFTQCLTERESIRDQPIISQASVEELEKIGKLVVPKSESRSVQDVLADSSTIFSQRVRMDHPRFFGFIPSPLSNVAWLGDVLAQAYDVHAGSWYQSSGPSAVEKRLIEWITKDLIGFASDGLEPGGCFVSGGSLANLQAMTAARDSKLVNLVDRQRGTIYMSSQTHLSVVKGLKLLGFLDRHIRKVECDDHFRINTTKLEEIIERDQQAGMKPFLLIGNAGSTNTGSIDDFTALSKIAHDANMWLHADGAYGASALLCESRRHLLKGIERCDSVSWDAHKWLFQTYACSVIVVRDKKLLLNSFQTSAEYIEDARESVVEWPNFYNYGIELTRPARAMKLWFTLQVEGLDKISSDIDHGFLLAETAEKALRELGERGWEIASPAQMGIICFRYVPLNHPLSELEVDELNKAISKRAIYEKVAAPLTTQLRGITVLRMCMISPSLRLGEVREIIDELHRIACSLDQINN